jgi:hypothetical protein
MFDRRTFESQIPDKGSRQMPQRSNIFASRSDERRVRIELEVMRKPWLFCGRGRKLPM